MARRSASLAIPGVLLAVVAAVLAGPAQASPAGDARVIRAGLSQAVKAGRLNADQATAHRRVLAKTLRAIPRLPASRSTTLRRVLWLVRLQAPRYNRPRGTALFSMLNQNRVFLLRRALPPDGTDVMGTDGIVYRVGWGYGLQFHPLANVIKLNLLLYAEKRRKALRLARGLQIRAVPRKQGRVWEYYFPYGGGSPPWTSGMAQAIGAQALARTGRRLTRPLYFPTANQAFLAIPGRLTLSTGMGPWVKLYSFSSMMVLNAQLQAALSIADAGQIMNRDRAIRLGARLESASRRLLGRFDTGYWTNYQPGSEAPLKYHLYHVDLARWLAQRTKRDTWENAHGRFARYSREPPVFKGGASGPTLYPWPADGWRDASTIRFWVSKISSSVTLRVAGRTWYLGARSKGWHAFVWRPGQRKPGIYRPLVAAVDLAGNRGQARIQRIEIAVDRTPPQVSAKVSRRTLTWSAVDAETPWLRMRVRLERAGKVRFLDLGRRGFSGSVRLSIPRGNWQARLVVRDSTGNRTRVELGTVPN